MPDRRHVDVRREGATCVLTLSRPDKLNALSSALEHDLLTALGSAEMDGARAVLVTGSGRAFSAGADVNEMRDADPASIAEYYRETGDVYERIAALPQPTVSAISGYCLGGGFELALATDFRIADETAVFGLPEVALGIIPSSGGTHRLVRAVGPARAKELMLLRDRIDARDAHSLGLVTEVVPEGEALARGLAVSARLAELPPLAVSLAKEAADRMGESSREAGIMIERLAYAVLAQTEEAQDAMREFTDRKRTS